VVVGRCGAAVGVRCGGVGRGGAVGWAGAAVETSGVEGWRKVEWTDSIVATWGCVGVRSVGSPSPREGSVRGGGGGVGEAGSGRERAGVGGEGGRAAGMPTAVVTSRSAPVAPPGRP